MEEAMFRKVFWSLAIVPLACSSGTAADIRRVVTGLDANNKAIALFDGRLTLKPGGSGNPAANLMDHGFVAARTFVQGRQRRQADRLVAAGQRHGDSCGGISAARSRRG